MPRDTPPATVRKPKPERQEPIRAKSPPKAMPKAIEKKPEPEPEPVKQGPSETIEEAFLRAGAAVIEAAPVLRDFQKEAVKFVPSIVKKRPPPKKAPKKEEEKEEERKGEERRDDEGVKGEMAVERSFATTVEDELEEDETTPMKRAPPAEAPAVAESTRMEPVISKPVAPATTEPSLKRPLEAEKKVESQPPLTAAPPKRRRMVNAAPDV